MSRLFISNQEAVVLKNIQENVHFYPQYATHAKGNWFEVFYEKKVFSLGNTYTDNADNFIGIVGSFLYKGLMGKEAAQLILLDFQGVSSISFMKKEIQGIYSIYINKNDTIFVFNDYYGLYDTCLTQQNDTIIIATSLKDIVDGIGSCEIEEVPFMMDVFHTGCFNELTSFKNIVKLTGGQYVILNRDKTFLLCNISMDEYKFKVILPHNVVASSYICERAVSCGRQISQSFKNISICMTGGLDSRTVLASFSDMEVKIELLYGQGNSLLTPTCVEDEQIVKLIATSLGYPLKLLNWRHPEASDDMDWTYQKKLFRELGFMNSIYVGNKNFIDGCRNEVFEKPCFLEFGYFMECLRLREWAESLKRDYFSLDEFVNQYYINKDLTIENYSNLDLLRDYLKDIFRKCLANIDPNINENKISLDYFERLRWNSARYSDSRVHFMLNEFGYCFPIYGIPSIHETILDLSANVIRDGKFQIEVLRLLDPSISKLPVFSHRRKFYITRDGKKRMKFNLKNQATLVLDKIPILKKIILKFYREIAYKDYRHNKSVIKKQLEGLKVDDIPTSFRLASFDDSTDECLYKLRQFIIGYNLLTKK